MGNMVNVKRKRWTLQDYIEHYLRSDEFNFDAYEDSALEVIGAVKEALKQNGILPDDVKADIQGLRFRFEREFTLDSDKLPWR